MTAPPLTFQLIPLPSSVRTTRRGAPLFANTDIDVDIEKIAVERVLDLVDAITTSVPIDNMSDRIENVRDPIDNTSDRIDNVSDPIDKMSDRIDKTSDRIDNARNPRITSCMRKASIAKPIFELTPMRTA
jgi:methyl-accepting chemotaxis protein